MRGVAVTGICLRRASTTASLPRRPLWSQCGGRFCHSDNLSARRSRNAGGASANAAWIPWAAAFGAGAVGAGVWLSGVSLDPRRLTTPNLLALCDSGVDQGTARSETAQSETATAADANAVEGTRPMWRSELSKPCEHKMSDCLILTGLSNSPLAESIAGHLGTKLGKRSLRRFADGEVALQILESIRGKDVYIIQSTSPPVNENLMELLLLISTCRRASAKKITAVIPYYGYARQDRKLSSRVPISAADVARLIETMGVDRVVAVDLHCGQIQGFFGPRVPVDNLEAQIIGLDYFQKRKLHRPIIVSPDAGGVYRARKFQEGLLARGAPQCGIAMLIKQRAGANKIERMDLVGNVADSDCIIVDDMIDTAGTLCEAARELRRHGARRVFAFATHGLFSGPAKDRIESSVLEEVVVTDSIGVKQDGVPLCKKITQLSIAVLVADSIRRIHQKESLHDLFHFDES